MQKPSNTTNTTNTLQALLKPIAKPTLGATMEYQLMNFNIPTYLKRNLGSGLIDHIQKITKAAIAIADIKVWAQRS